MGGAEKGVEICAQLARLLAFPDFQLLGWVCVWGGGQCVCHRVNGVGLIIADRSADRDEQRCPRTGPDDFKQLACCACRAGPSSNL